MANLSALEPFTTSATALSNLVLVTPGSTTGYQPQVPPNADGTPSVNLQQPPALLFHYEGEQALILESDITDHFVEDNSAIQDQIALKPEVFNTQGFIGELNNVAPGFLKPLKIAADKLTVIGAYTPELSETALIAYNEAFFAYQVAANVLNSAVAAWSSVSNLVTGDGEQAVVDENGLTGGSLSQNKQQEMFQQFYGYWRNRTLFTLQTPWAVFKNMAIKSLRAVQDADTRMITTFEVSFKMIRKASTMTTITGVSQLFQNRSNTQSSSLTDLGTSSGTPGPSLTSGLSTMGVA